MSEAGRRARVYGLTAKGRRKLTRRRNRWLVISAAVTKMLRDGVKRTEAMGLWSRLGRTLRCERHGAEIDEECSSISRCSPGEQDRREARLRLGNVTRVREETRAMGIVGWLESGRRRTRATACASCASTPALSLAVVLSLTVGLGANTAIFSLVDAAILRPLPVGDPDALVIVAMDQRRLSAGHQESQRRVRPDRGRQASGLVDRRQPLSSPGPRADDARRRWSAWAPTRTRSPLPPETRPPSRTASSTSAATSSGAGRWSGDRAAVSRR